MRDIQVFVSGALAIDGLRSLIASVRHLASTHSYPAIYFSTAFAALALLLGIGILFKSIIAVRLAQAYLFLIVAAGLLGSLASSFGPDLPILRQTFFHMFAYSLLVYVPLLVLLLCSQWLGARRDETAI